MPSTLASDAPTKLRPRTWQAVIALFLVTIIWGCSFVWMKQGLQAAEAKLGSGHRATGVALFMAIRFGLAAAIMPIFVPASRRLARTAWKGGFYLGGLLYLGFVLQMLGLQEVTPAVSAFLTSLYVLFTALLTAFLQRRGLSLALGAGVLLATFGAGFIRGRPELAFNLGEMLTVGCAVLFAVHILVTDRITRVVEPMPVTFTSFAWLTVGSLALLVVVQLAPGAAPPSALVDLVRSADFMMPVCLTALFASAVAISMMNVYQRELDPVRAAILYALEPIWAAVVGVGMGTDELTRYLWLGGALLLSGNLIAEIGQQRRTGATATA